MPGAQPSNITIKQKSSNVKGATDPAAREEAPGRIVGPNSNNAGSATGKPTSAPTPSAERLVIKTKSTPPVAPQNPLQIEERGANPTNPTGKPSAASLGAVRQCGPGMVWVQDGPHHGQGHCERKPVPQD